MKAISDHVGPTDGAEKAIGKLALAENIYAGGKRRKGTRRK
jgi:hypothetical protein